MDARAADDSPPPPPDAGRKSDLGLLAVVMLLGLLVHARVIAHTEVAARDSIGFIRFALNLEEPPPDPADPAHTLTRLDVVRRAEHPPGYPTLVLLVSWPVRALAGGTTCESMVLSAQVASALAGVLLAVPMFLLGRTLFDRRTAFAAAALFQVLPVCAQVTSDGLSDGLFLLAAATTLWLGVRAFRTPTTLRFAACGLGSGFAYLVRPEGLILAAAVGFVLVAWKLLGRLKWRAAFAQAGGLTAGVLAVAAPYVVTVGGLTVKPTGKGLFQFLRGQDVTPTWHSQPGAKADKETRRRGDKETGREEDCFDSSSSCLLVSSSPCLSSPPRLAGTLYAAWLTEKPDSRQSRPLWAARALGAEFFQSFFYVPPVLALIGIFGLRQRIWREPGLALLVALPVLHALLLCVLAMSIGYLSERHTLLLVLVGCFFAAAALPLIGRELAKRPRLGRLGGEGAWAGGLAAGLLLAALPGALKPLHANRAGHHAAGRWLAGHAAPQETIWDPFCWAEFYAGRSMRTLPRPHPQNVPVYVILEPTHATPHSRLPMLAQAREMAKAGELVYHWPEQKPPAEAKVAVFRVVPPGAVR